jgi:hypothetical protein
MDAKVRERQIERAWIKHDPARLKIPSESWRALRRYKSSIAADAARIMAASEATARLRALLIACFRKGTLARQKARAIQALREYISPAVLTASPDALLWAWPEPRGTIIISDDPAKKQDCIVAAWGAMGQNRPPALQTRPPRDGTPI